MKVFKENPLLLCWLILLTSLGVYLCFTTNVNVKIQVHAPEGVSVSNVHGNHRQTPAPAQSDRL